MRQEWAIAAGALFLTGCDAGISQSNHSFPKGHAHLVIDGVDLFIPVAWNAGRSWYSRPWQNGVLAGTGGWGDFKPWAGAIEKIDPHQTYISVSEGQRTRADRPDPFFFMRITFEFPEPSQELSLWHQPEKEKSYALSLDTLTFSYVTKAENIERPYEKILRNIRPDDGADVGNGWRQLHGTFKGRSIALRFDAHDWQTRGGALPRRIAASFSPSFWSHFETFDQPRWAASFETQNLPVAQWRIRYATADQLFVWLRTPPAQRDAKKRFIWWSDLRYRPIK